LGLILFRRRIDARFADVVLAFFHPASHKKCGSLAIRRLQERPLPAGLVCVYSRFQGGVFARSIDVPV
jgi:hypothetical protein